MSQQLNIAIVSDVFPPKCGGSGWSSYYLAQALRQCGHNLHVVIPREGKEFGTRQREYEGLPVTEFIYPASRIPFVRNYTRNERLYPRFADWLETFFRENSIQVAHGQHYLTIPPVVMAAQKTGAVSLGTIRDYWPVCYWTTHLSGDRICPGCSEKNRLICLYRNQGPVGIPAAPVSFYMGANLKLKQKWLAKADAVLAVSHYVAGKLAPVVPAAKLQVLPTFIDMEPLENITPADQPDPYLLFTGKLETNKGAGLLMDILRLARPTLPVLIAGEGALRASMEETARRENLNVQFLGWVEHDRVLELMAGAEALLFPSLWPEPLTRVLLEAIAVGSLVVAMDTGGTSDIIENKVNGLLAGTVSEMASRLTEILKPENTVMRQQLRESARCTAQDKFSQPVVVEQVEKLYLELARRKGVLKS